MFCRVTDAKDPSSSSSSPPFKLLLLLLLPTAKRSKEDNQVHKICPFYLDKQNFFFMQSKEDSHVHRFCSFDSSAANSVRSPKAYKQHYTNVRMFSLELIAPQKSFRGGFCAI